MALWVLLAGCTADGDGDGDGWTVEDGDCDDSNSEVHPEADETCDGLDNDCDGAVDEEDAVDAPTWYQDFDGDGFGRAADAVSACSAPEGYVDNSEDCADLVPAVNPDAEEACNGRDDDCDGLIDDDDASLTGAPTWYEDADGDGYGDTATGVSQCEEPSGYVDVDDDCDDEDGATHPGAASSDHATACMTDVDGDDWGEMHPAEGVEAGTDCNDQFPFTYPGAAAADSETLCMTDGDGDEFGNDTPREGIEPGTDCNDFNRNIHPDATEVCGDGVDDDCDGGPSGCGLDGSYAGSAFDAMYAGEARGDQAGHSVASAGDVDDDGYTDLLVGAPYNDNGARDAGIVYVVLGGTAANVALRSADALLEGVAAYDGVGWSPDGLSGGGDVDGDGYGDILVGTGYNDDAGYSTAGAAYLVSGPPSDMELGDAGTIFYGDAAEEYFGWSTSIPGDLDGDGYADMVIGAFLANDGTTTNQGEVYVFHGDCALSDSYDATDADTTFYGEATKDRAGWALSGGGDVDGDGVGDLAIGANNAYLSSAATRPGAAYVVTDVDSYSGTSTDLADVDARLDGESDGDNAGYSVDIGGDADGDGYADLLVGAYMNDDAGYTDAGKAYFVSGSDIADMDLGTGADTEFLGEGSTAYGTYAGECVAILPDTNGDGYDEVAVGSMNADGSYRAQGKLYLFLGPVDGGSLDLGSDPDAVFEGSSHSDGMGFSVAGLEDFDGDDGLGDVLVGAIGEDSGGANAGAAYLMLGTGF